MLNEILRCEECGEAHVWGAELPDEGRDEEIAEHMNSDACNYVVGKAYRKSERNPENMENTERTCNW